MILITISTFKIKTQEKNDFNFSFQNKAVSMSYDGQDGMWLSIVDYKMLMNCYLLVSNYRKENNIYRNLLNDNSYTKLLKQRKVLTITTQSFAISFAISIGFIGLMAYYIYTLKAP
jgi:hypothetical protein